MRKIYTPATKSLDPWDVDDNRGWSLIGAEAKPSEIELVPTLADCVDEIGKGLADLPFTVYDAKGVAVDDSDDYKNVTGAIPDPYAFLWLTGASLVMSGEAYWSKKLNRAGFAKALQYWAFQNVTPQIRPETTTQNLTFRRDGQTSEVSAKDVLYIWLPDPRVEFGPAVNYPLARALKSAGALSAIASFIDNYMNSGMVKAFIAQSEVQPSSKEEKDEIEDYLTRMLTGVKRALQKIRVIKKTMTITAIGGGLDELKNVAVVKEIKQDILEAFGVPASRVWGNAANYATAANDTIVFITSEIMPIARAVQNALNEQLLKPYGYRLQFEPRRMEEFAVILGEKVKSLEMIAKSFERAMGPAEALKAAIDLLGLDLSPELIECIEKAIEEENKPKPEPVAPVVIDATAQPAIEQQPPAQPEPTPAQKKALVELDKWRDKSAKAGKLVTWHAVYLPAEIVTAVKGGMEWEDARAMLTDVPEYKAATISEPSEILTLASAINRAADMSAVKSSPAMVSPSYTVNLTAQMPAPGEPTITVNVPQQPAPVVNITTPEQPAPSVTVTNEVAAPVVNVTAIPGESRLIMPSPAPVEIVRDRDGKATGIRPK